jgi:hypothetical protein
MTALALNAELAYRVLDHIDAHPEQHDQGLWFAEKYECGTVACFAGWTAMLAGGRLAKVKDEWDFATTVIVGGLPEELIGKHVSYAAAVLLGIAEDLDDEDEAQALRIFNGHNTREDLGELVAETFGPRPAAAPDRWSAMIPNPHPLANCGPLLMQLPPGVMCPTCGTVPPVPDPTDDVPPNAGSAS